MIKCLDESDAQTLMYIHREPMTTFHRCAPWGCVASIDAATTQEPRALEVAAGDSSD